MLPGQTQTLNYQFCPQANYDFVSANATAFMQGVFITSQLWTYLGSVAAGGCLSGSFTISIPSNATAGSYEDDVVTYCKVTTSDGNWGYCSNDQAITYYPLVIAGSSTTTLQNVTATIECTPTSISTQNDVASCSAKLSDNAINPTGTFTLSTNSSGGSFETAVGGKSCLIDSVTLQCSFSYTDTTLGTALITASYSGDNENAATTGTTTITVTAPTPTQCPALWLTEGLAPAASTTGDDNVYVTIHWAGQTPVSVELGAFASSPTIDVDFAFNPVTMQGPTISVLMNVMTSHTADGTYTISVAAQLTDPASNQPCSANMKAYVTVSGTTVFVGTLGDQQTTAIWVSGMPSPFMVSGNISASQYSNFTPTVDANGKLTSLAWSVTGPPNTTGQGRITIPKTLVTVGLGPVVLIDNIPVGITVTQDSSNYYITYTTRFSTHQVVLEFVTPGNTTTATTSNSSQETSLPSGGIVTVLIIGVVVWIAIIAGIYFLIRTIRRRLAKRRSGKPANVQPA
jgi:hypothetical protein